MELLDIYDRNRVPTGKTLPRGSTLGNNEYHLVVHVCIFNSQNEMLIQLRQPWKKSWPDLWDLSVGGCVLAGETSKDAAHRETLEELGLDIDFSEERPYFTINFANGFDDYYLIERDLPLEALTIQTEEVKAVKWASKEEVLQLAQEGKFINYWFLEHLFEIRKHWGAYIIA